MTVVYDTTTAANNQVTYTVENAVEGANHRIALFDADDLTVDADGVVTFTAQAGTIAEQTAVASEIISMNSDTNATTNLDSQLTDGFEPTSGSFTFTVETQTGVFENVVPVVFFDDPADLQNGVNVDADGVPADSALFGVAGGIEALPQELASGNLNAFTAGADDNAEVVFADKDRDIIIIGDTPTGQANATVRHVSYGAADSFFVDAGAAANRTNSNHASDLDGFEDRLAVGDELVANSTAQTVYSRTAASVFVLNDLQPSDVQGVDATAVSDELGAIDVVWTDLANASSYNIYRANGSALAANANRDAADESSFSLVGSVDASADNEFNDTGLANATAYTYWVTGIIDGVESGFNTAADDAFDTATTLAAGALTAPTITSASVETDNNLQSVFDAEDVWTIVFDKEMDDFTANGQFVISNGTSQVTVECGTLGGTTNDAAVCALAAAAGGTPASSVLTITFAAGADFDLTFNEGGNAYPLTIVTTNAAVQDTFGNPVSIANSADASIN